MWKKCLSFIYCKTYSANRVYYKILGLPIISIKSSIVSSKYRFLFLKWKKYHIHFPVLTPKILRLATHNPTLLWWDHGLGGGTDYYFSNQKALLLPKHTILRVQYILEDNCYLLTLFQSAQTYASLCFSSEQLQQLLSNLRFSQIVVNNLVSYPMLPETLDFIATLKEKNACQISFRLHDFYVVCPFSYNLMVNNHVCNGPQQEVCLKCTYVQVAQNLQQFTQWRKMWGNFLQNTIDEILVFSENSKTLLLTAFSFLAPKIQVHPHFVPKLRPIKIAPHATLNIVVLGNIVNYAKGMGIVTELEHHLSTLPQLRLIVIGTYAKSSAKTIVTGPYKREDLPELLETYQADIILVPSICPETFSYTTSEAILSGLPVACFNMGAQAEKIKSYSKGLVISTINAKAALQEIWQFQKNNIFQKT